MQNNRDELLNHLAASLKDAKADGGAILLVGAGISVSAGIPPAQQLMKIAIENFPDYFTEEQLRLAQEDLGQLQYNDIMTKLSPIHRKEIFNWHIKGNEKKNIPKAKLNFAHLAIAELLKQGYIKRILTTNFDPLLINACYMVGMYPLPSIYDLGSINQINPELFDDPCIIYLNGQHAGQVQRNTASQLMQHKSILNKVVFSTGCKRPWIISGYSGENDPLMESLNELRPYNNWLYWLEYNEQVLQNVSHHFLENDEECKIICDCDADIVFMEIAKLLKCNLNFIEYPAIEFQQYNDFINFNTAQSKKIIYERKIQTAIQLLKRISNDPEFSVINILDERLAHLEKRIQRKNINDSNMMELLLKQCEELSELDSEFFVVYFYWGNMLYELAENSPLTEEKIKYTDLAHNKYEELFKHHPDPSQLVYLNYFKILKAKADLTADINEKEKLLTLALKALNNEKLQNFDFKHLNLEKAKIAATFHSDINIIIKYLEASPFLSKKEKNKLTVLASTSYLDRADVDIIKELDPYRNELLFQQWYKKTFDLIDS